MFDPITTEQRQALEAKHGPLHEAETPRGIVYFRCPSKDEFLEAQEAGKKGTDEAATEALVKACVLFPGKESLDPIFARYPLFYAVIFAAINPVAAGKDGKDKIEHLDQEKLDKFNKEHGEVHQVDTHLGKVYFRCPRRPEVVRYQQEREAKTLQSKYNLASSCVLHPDAGKLRALMTIYPLLPVTLTPAMLDVSTGSEEHIAKKAG